jgi:hypothetical protein
VPDNPFVGIWRLISCNAVRRNGCVLPLYGKNPIGRLFYDAEGNMSVNIMKPGRLKFVSASKSHGTSLEMRAAYLGYEAYFSTYMIDREKGVIRHHLIGSLFPNWTGSEQARYYKFEGSRLILSTAPIGMAATRETVVTLVWEKINYNQ